MDEEILFRIIFIVIYGVFAGVRVYYRSQTLGRNSEKEYSQKTKAMIVLTIAILGYFLAIGLWIIFPQTIGLFQITLPVVIRLCGIGTSIVAIAFTIWIHRVLGRQYSAKLEIQKGHQLITEGPYGRIRHPMYTTLNMFSLSVSLITANLLIILLAIFVAIPFYWIVRDEEQMLLEQFGDEYLQYMKITGRFFPRIR